MTKHLSCIEIEPPQPARQSMIWLHGLGADGNDFVSLATELHSSITSTTRFIFPHAPMMPVTLNNGYMMRAWFDIHAIDIHAKVDVKGITESIAQVEQLIAKEQERGIRVENIFLGGFSQGAAIALIAGLTRQGVSLGGILALSGYLPPADELRNTILSRKQHPPVFEAHGTLDAIVPFGLGLATYEWLTQAGCTIDWHTYPIAHTVCREEIDDISTWLQQTLIKNK